MWPANASSSVGKSERKWPPRLSARASALSAISRGSERGRVEQPLEPGGVADHARVLARAPARSSRRDRRLRRRHGGGAGRRGAGLARARRARRGGRRRGTRAASSRRAGSRRGRRCRRTRRRRRGRAASVRAVEVGDDAADRVVRGRRDRDRLGGRVVAGALERRHQAGKRPRSIARRSRPAWPRSAIARATTSRGASSSVKRLAVVVDEQRALAAQRLGEQEAVVERARSGGTGRTRGRRARRRRGRRARAPRRARRAGSSSAPRAPRSRRSRAASRAPRPRRGR